MPQNQISNGNFRNPDGSPVANGNLKIQLNRDCAIAPTVANITQINNGVGFFVTTVTVSVNTTKTYWIVGDNITIAGTTYYNGTFPIQTISPTQITYIDSGLSDPQPGVTTGTITTNASNSGQIGRESVVTVPLNSAGNVSGTVLIWPNDQLLPYGSQYIFKIYSSQGQLLAGPYLETITTHPSPFLLP